ncbi:hypothetical protein [Natranaerofaba carboxydovora]|uniref:hypothetical protein n=1 Tax=Natranaerofaba carboxydovora TaxID=2742683 RepID=UPI001F13933B|nr:hypothetical protein [Natranaerofaba carboxydovora]UMZ72545.1 hypothetical protein ACONDI_00066 [Natranaerofaba carboxydovora]
MELVIKGGTSSDAIGFFRNNKEHLDLFYKAHIKEEEIYNIVQTVLILYSRDEERMEIKCGLATGYSGTGPSTLYEILTEAGFDISFDLIKDNKSLDCVLENKDITPVSKKEIKLNKEFEQDLKRYYVSHVGPNMYKFKNEGVETIIDHILLVDPGQKAYLKFCSNIESNNGHTVLRIADPIGRMIENLMEEKQ